MPWAGYLASVISLSSLTWAVSSIVVWQIRKRMCPLLSVRQDSWRRAFCIRQCKTCSAQSFVLQEHLSQPWARSQEHPMLLYMISEKLMWPAWHGGLHWRVRVTLIFCSLRLLWDKERNLGLTAVELLCCAMGRFRLFVSPAYWGSWWILMETEHHIFEYNLELFVGD